MVSVRPISDSSHPESDLLISSILAYTWLYPYKQAYIRGYSLCNSRTTNSTSSTCKILVESKSSTYNRVCLHQFIPLNRIQSHSHYIMCETTIAISSSSRSTWSKYHCLGTSALINICKYHPIIIRTHHHVSNKATLSSHSCINTMYLEFKLIWQNFLISTTILIHKSACIITIWSLCIIKNQS